MTISAEEFKFREDALLVAQKFVEPLVDKFPPEAYKSVTQPAPIFSAAPNYTVNPLEQVISNILTIADWLLYERE